MVRNAVLLLFLLISASTVIGQKLHKSVYLMGGHESIMNSSQFGGGVDAEIKLTRKRGASIQFFFVTGIGFWRNGYDLEKTNIFKDAGYSSLYYSERIYLPILLRITVMPWAINKGRSFMIFTDIGFYNTYLLRSRLRESFDKTNFVFDEDITSLFHSRYLLFNTDFPLPAYGFQMGKMQFIIRTYRAMSNNQIKDVSGSWNIPDGYISHFYGVDTENGIKKEREWFFTLSLGYSF